MCLKKPKKIEHKDYDSHILKQDKKQRELLSDFYIDSAKVLLNIRRFNESKPVRIDFEDLDSFPLNEWVNVNDKVRIRKTLSEDKKLEFDTEMKSGGKFGWHVHNDCSESTEVIKGKLHDVLTSFEYEEGETAIWIETQEHIPIALEDSLLKVNFFR